MKKFFTLLCMVAWMVGYTSCQDDALEQGSSSENVQLEVKNEKVKKLIQQARNCDAEAYKALALCYQDGEGVGRSWLNMLCMYFIYAKGTGQDLFSVVCELEEDNPCRLIPVLLNSSSSEELKDKIDQFEDALLMEVKAFRVIENVLSNEMDSTALTLLEEAEREGSELGALMQVFYYEVAKDEAGLEQCLNRLAGRFPFLNSLIGERFASKYLESGVAADIQKAVEYYYKADEWGMLTPWYAAELLEICECYGDKGLFDCSETEMERLRKIANLK